MFEIEKPDGYDRRDSMTEKTPSTTKHLLTEELFDYADRFKAAKLWTKLGEMQLFAISWKVVSTPHRVLPENFSKH